MAGYEQLARFIHVYLLLLPLLVTYGSCARSLPKPKCIRSCEGQPDGNYISCYGCRFFATCVSGVLYDRRLCPGDLLWNDVTKSCEQNSETCVVRRLRCVRSCAKLQDGEYPSCRGCRFYVTCSQGRKYDRQRCPGGLQFDDVRRRCVKKSLTCHMIVYTNPRLRHRQRGPRNLDEMPEEPFSSARRGDTSSLNVGTSDGPGSACVRDCAGLPTGNYQSCRGCNMYVSCKDGTTIDGRLCSQGTSWDDDLKKCVERSSTCRFSVTNGPRTLAAGACVNSCEGLPNGQYQSCQGCHYFVTCMDEVLIEDKPCDPHSLDLFWDDNIKLCLPQSTTCTPGTGSPKATITKRRVIATGTCVNNCEDVSDGNYQSCQGCHVFVTCRNGVIFDNRHCGVNSVWDDRLKQCAPTSETCGESHGNCVSSCEGLTNGNYQSCNGCHLYLSCHNGTLVAENTCPDELVWDDDLKLCVHTSSTCNYGERKKKPPDGTGKVDVKEGGKDGLGTTEALVLTVSANLSTEAPVTSPTMTSETVGTSRMVLKTTEGTRTSSPLMNVTVSEPKVTSFDDNITSSDENVTSGVAARTASCINSCYKVPDGSYQSCYGCHGYIVCSAGNLHQENCPSGLSWDNTEKECVTKSVTCGPGFGGCVRSNDCRSLRDGDYQSCHGCHIYITCSNGEAHDNRPCPAGLVWDDLVRWCVKSSSTCVVATTGRSSCVTSCNGRADGDYQSCKGCDRHVTCRNGELVDDRSCPKGLKFDSNEKRCLEKSKTCGPGKGDCIKSCEGLDNGDYRSCHSCHMYATCTDGVLTDKRPCPSRLVWDDIRKQCLRSSLTCDPEDGPHAGGVSSSGNELLTSGNHTGGNETWEGHIGDGVCVSSCVGRLNGDYQSCQGCNMFAACLNGVLYDRRPCPEGLVWEDTIKHCLSSSTTCSPGRGGCVSSCEGLPAGDYQSCHSCHVYVSCNNGFMEDDRPCPAGEVWDDQRKRCELSSVTCPKVNRNPVPAGVCVYDCEGLPDGDYQSCLGCTGYVTCTSGVLHDNRPCPTGLVWDDKKKRCRYASQTCRPGRGMCTRTCAGLPDGDYQSCHGCRLYATCSDGVLHDDRPCPPSTYWDDSLKRCMRWSPTCGAARSAHAAHSRQRTVDPALLLAQQSGGRLQAVTRSCVSSCDGLPDGDYQSCRDCRVYVTCREGAINDDRPCPSSTVWDDNQKRCLRASATCSSVIVLGSIGAGATDVGVPSPSRGGNHPRHVGPAPGNCISSCEGRENGDYQSCLDCRVYATCQYGVLHDNRPCPRHSLWDDLRKRCLYASSTCYMPGHQPPTPRPPRRRVGSRHRQRNRHSGSVITPRVLPRPLSCVSSCDGRSDGDYQSCHDCRLYATCAQGVLNDYRPCPVNTYWDDQRKRCLVTSSTCTGFESVRNRNVQQPTRHRPRTPHLHRSVHDCIASCDNIADGDYHSCRGCNMFASCIRGVLFDARACPHGLLWNDAQKRCDFTSASCNAAASTRRHLRSDRRCVSSCAGHPAGDYQSCRSCHMYITCSRETAEVTAGIERPCPGRTVWDDNLKRCLWTSVTCRE